MWLYIMFLNLHQDTRSSNGLEFTIIWAQMSMSLSQLPAQQLWAPTTCKRKKKKKNCVRLGRELCISIFWERGLCQKSESKLQALPSTYQLSFMWSGLVFAFSSTPSSRTVWKCSQVFRKKLICTIPSGRCKTSQKQCWGPLPKFLFHLWGKKDLSSLFFSSIFKGPSHFLIQWAKVNKGLFP